MAQYRVVLQTKEHVVTVEAADHSEAIDLAWLDWDETAALCGPEVLECYEVNEGE